MLRKSLLAISAMLIAVVLAVAPRLSSSAQTSANQWPTFHADMERTGSVAATGTTVLNQLAPTWQLSCANQAGNPIPCLNPYTSAMHASLVIDAKGAAYGGAET